MSSSETPSNIYFLCIQNKSTKIQYEEKFLEQLSSKCSSNDNSSCVMMKLLDYMNKMLKKPSFTIGKRITLLQTRSVFSVAMFIDRETCFSAIAHFSPELAQKRKLSKVR